MKIGNHLIVSQLIDSIELKVRLMIETNYNSDIMEANPIESN